MVRKILVSQPQPKDARLSPYFQLYKKRGVQVDYQPFIKIKGVTKEEFIKQKVDLSDYRSVVFTNTNAINNFFNIAKLVRHDLTNNMNYFCQTHILSNYLNKYISYRKRRIHYAEAADFRTIEDSFHKYKDDMFLFPSSNLSYEDPVSKSLEEMEINFDKVILYKTECKHLSNMSDIFNYDMLVFFCPSSIRSLTENFPNFKQNNIKLAAFGNSTVNAVKEAGLRCDVEVDRVSSIVKAIDDYIEHVNNMEGK